MIKNSLIAIVGCLLASALFAGGYMLVAGGSETASPPAKHDKPKAKTWNGAAQRQMNATFVRSGIPITVERYIYKDLNTPSTDVDIVIRVPANDKGQLPDWIAYRGSFVAHSTDARTYRPKLMQSQDGSDYLVTVSFKDLPTSYLGPTKDEPNGPGETVKMTIRAPDAPFSVGIIAPQAPAGHELAETAPPKPVTKKPVKPKAAKKKAAKKRAAAKKAAAKKRAAKRKAARR